MKYEIHKVINGEVIENPYGTYSSPELAIICANVLGLEGFEVSVVTVVDI